MKTLDLAVELTAAERDMLTVAESVIERGIKTFREVGDALLCVRENRLYRAEFSTFEDYADQKWGLSRAYANRLVAASSVAAILAPIGAKINNEAQARVLAPLLDNPDQLRSAYVEASERTNGRPTAAAIREVLVERELPEPSPQFAAAFDKAMEARPDPAPPVPEQTRTNVADLYRRIGPATSIKTSTEFFLDGIRGIDPDLAISEAPATALPSLDLLLSAHDFLTRVVNAVRRQGATA